MRRELLAKNKILRYLTYAGGEILLVIIGILVALQINNINEERKNREKVEAILVQIYEDLEVNILDATDNLNYLFLKDSLVRVIINGGLNTSNIQLPRTSMTISAIYTTGSFAIVDNGFKNWSKVENIPEEYQDLMNFMNFLFLTGKKDVETVRQMVTNGVNKAIEYQAKHFDWFAPYYNNAFSGNGPMMSEAVDFYLNDPAYKNQAMLYFIYAIQNYLPVIDNYRNVSISAYKKIGELLELPLSENAKNKFLPENDYLQKLAGNYIDDKNPSLNPTIKVGENKLTYRLNNFELDLTPISELDFVNAQMGAAARISFKMRGDTVYAMQEYEGGRITELRRLQPGEQN